MSRIILYPKGETSFDTNGLGALVDVLEDEICEELNGQFELSFQYPITGSHFADLAKGMIVTADSSPVSGPQPFEIYRIAKASRGLVTVYARHIAYKNRKITVAPFTAASAPSALLGLKSNAVNECLFDFWTDKTTEGTFSVPVPQTIWTLLGNSEGSILDTYGGEYEFDRFTVKLWNRRGADWGVTIRYGKNLTSLEMDENISNTYNAVYPYWTDPNGNLVQLQEKIVHAEGAWDEELILPLDCSQHFETAPSEDALRQYAEQYIESNDIGKPDVSWTVEFVQLEQTEEYKGKALLERVLLGDTVTVYFPQLGVNASARAVAARYRPTLSRYKNITLGRVKANIATTIAQQAQSIKSKPSVSLVQSIVMSLTASILGARGGAVRLLDTDGDRMPDTLYVADNADPAKAVKVWRWNYEGWAGSKAGYNGPFILGATLEDGLLAEAVTAANLVAGTIRSKDGESFFVNLDTGEVSIKAVTDLADSTNKQITEVTQTAEGIVQSAMKDYVQQAEYNSFLEHYETTIDQRAEKVAITVSQANKDSIGEVDNRLDELIRKIEMYFGFESDGLHIRKSGANIETLFANDIWQFMFSGAQQLYIDKDGVHGDELYTKNIYIGDLIFKAEADGSVVLS